MVRTRFAPSPTGPLHVGGARTALFNYLFTRKNSGKFVLRIEDTDLERSRPEFERDIESSLEWLGITPDESPQRGGPYGPYRQSERLQLYEEAFEKLKEKGLLYRCFCTDEELSRMKQDQMAKGLKIGYDRRCLRLSEAEVKKFVKEGREHAWRFILPERKVRVKDIIKGDVEIDLSSLSDFVVKRSDGSPSFHLAVVVDDIAMKITHVIRGEDHLANTGFHIVLYEALGENPPVFGHLPLVFSKEKGKLSKRAPSSTISELRRKGVLPEAIVNYLVSLGYHISLDYFFNIETIAKEFNIQKVSKSAVVYDEEMLFNLNRKWLRKLPVEELIFRAKAEGFTCADPRDERVKEWAQIWTENSENLRDLAENIQILFRKPETDKPIELRDEKLGKAMEFIREFVRGYNVKNNWLDKLTEAGAEMGIKKAELFKALRIALVGREYGPSISEIVRILGEKEVKKRLLENQE